ncbi:muscleblind-like splicing regulator [Nesidiocoris tenuis]|uniref:Muscleblind-like splicing regulator n=1 Tax=Nesidiocoris tenuis TaxID=355587 RepID=A0ABN7ACG0_9HEMI|nr:muscleblind-like splicing regulator [Nesidiocoris tenuis]
MQQMGLTPGQPVVPGQVPTAVAATTTYLAGVPQIGSTFSPYFSPGPIMPLTVAPDPTGSLSMVQQSVVAQQKMPRTDRLEMDMKSVGSFYYENFFPGMVPYKRAAGDKSGVPMYQPASATYQQLLHQPFVPVSCEYRTPSTAAFTGVALNKVLPPPSQYSYPAVSAAAAYSQLPHTLTSLAQHHTTNTVPAVSHPLTNHHPSMTFQLHHHQTAPVRPPTAPSSLPPTPLISDLITPYPTPINNNNEDELQPFKKMKTT